MQLNLHNNICPGVNLDKGNVYRRLNPLIMEA